MRIMNGLRQTGVTAALGAAALFGAGTPLAKLLLDSVSPWLLAGLLYLGSGIGLGLYRYFTKAPAVRLEAVQTHGLPLSVVSCRPHIIGQGPLPD